MSNMAAKGAGSALKSIQSAPTSNPALKQPSKPMIQKKMQMLPRMAPRSRGMNMA